MFLLFYQWLGDQKLQSDLVYGVTSEFEGQEVSHCDSVASDRHLSKQNVDRTSVGNISARIEEKNNSPSPLKHAFSDVLADESLKKMDSFNRWMSKELDVSEIHMESSTGAGSYWDPVEGENVVNSNNSEEHGFTLSPSLSQDQLFSIMDFAPNWGYSGLEVKVLTHILNFHDVAITKALFCLLLSFYCCNPRSFRTHVFIHEDGAL